MAIRLAGASATYVPNGLSPLCLPLPPICPPHNMCLLPPLHLASLFGHFSTVDLLAQHGGDVNLKVEIEKDEYHTTTHEITPFSAALRSKSLPTLRKVVELGALIPPLSSLQFRITPNDLALLVELGADINAADSRGFNFLHQICSVDSYISIDFIPVLIELGLDVNAMTNDGRTAIQLIQGDDNRLVQKVRLLLENGAIMSNESKFWMFLDQVPSGHKTVSPIVVKAGNVKLVQLMIEGGASIQSDAAIRIAVEKGDVGMVRKLVEMCNMDDKTYGIDIALLNNNIGMVHELLQLGADVTSSPALVYAIKGGNEELVKEMIARLHPNYMDIADYYNVIDKASKQPKMMRILKQCGTRRPSNKGNLLNNAVNNLDMDTVKFLVEEWDFDINKDFSLDPLNTAVKKDNLEMFKFLLEMGADLNIRPKILGLAVSNSTSITRFLISNGYYLGDCNPDGSASFSTIRVLLRNNLLSSNLSNSLLNLRTYIVKSWDMKLWNIARELLIYGATFSHNRKSTMENITYLFAEHIRGLDDEVFSHCN